MVNYTIQDGTRAGALEVLFSSKPGDATREALKNLKFRWNGAKKVWYGFTERDTLENMLKGISEELKEDQSTGESNAINMAELEKYGGESFEGYMGGHGWKGSNSKFLYGAELTKAIREALKRCNIKGVTLSKDTYSGGQSVCVTIQEQPGDLISFDEFKSTFINDDGTLNYSKAYNLGNPWLYYRTTDQSAGGYGGKCVDSILVDKFMTLDDPTMKKLIFFGAIEQSYNSSLCGDINHYHYKDHPIFTEQFKNRFSAIMRVVNSFNYEDTNSMVDYFDVQFYTNYKLKRLEA